MGDELLPLISREEMIQQLGWLLESKPTPEQEAEALGAHMDPKLTTIRRLMTGQVKAISPRYLRRIIELLKD